MDAPDESWRNLNQALRQGLRGLPGGSSLAQLLAEHRHTRNKKRLPRLRIPQILAWAKHHYKKTGRWPTRSSGPVHQAPGETWAGIDAALQKGCRGLTAGTSLAQLLAERLGVRNRKALPRLQKHDISAWAVAHRDRHGKWPNEKSGPIEDAPGETWAGVNAALREGLRGLPGGRSLFQFLQRS